MTFDDTDYMHPEWLPDGALVLKRSSLKREQDFDEMCDDIQAEIAEYERTKVMRVQHYREVED